MVKNTKSRTWTLKGKASKIGMVFNFNGDTNTVISVPGGQVAEHADPVYDCPNVHMSSARFQFTRLWLNGIDEWEVTNWLQHTAQGQVDFRHENAPDGGALIHFTFHDSNDALKFKLMFAEGLESGAVAY